MHAVATTPAESWMCLLRSPPSTMAAFPEIQAGRLPYHPFRGLLAVHSRYDLLGRQVPCRTPHTEGLSRFVTSTTAPIAAGWTDSCRGGRRSARQPRLAELTPRLRKQHVADRRAACARLPTRHPARGV